MAHLLGAVLGPTTLRGCRMLELGCGSAAILSLTAAALGAHTTATDLPTVVPMAQHNVAINCAVLRSFGVPVRNESAAAPGAAAPPSECGTVRVCSYSWGSDLAKCDLTPPFDLIVGTNLHVW